MINENFKKINDSIGTNNQMINDQNLNNLENEYEDYEIPKTIDSKIFKRTIKIYSSIMFATFFIGFFLIVMMIVFLSFSFSTTTTYSSWKKLNFYGILSPIAISSVLFIIINVSLSVGFYFILDKFDASLNDIKSELICWKLAYYNKWIIVSSVLLVSSFIIAMIGLYNLYYLSGQVTWGISAILLFGSTGINIYFILMISSFIFKKN